MKKQDTTKKDVVKNDIPDVDISNANDALEKAVMELIYNEPFFANLTLNMRREFTTKFPTLAVNVTDEVNLYINPYFFCNYSLQEQVSFLKHECLHVLNNHFVRFRDLEPQIYDDKQERTIIDRMKDMMNASTLNQAADYAINEYLPHLPQKVVSFDEKGKKLINPENGKPMEGELCLVKHLKKRIPHIIGEQNLEYYYEFLKQEQEKNEKNGGKMVVVGVGGNDQGQTLDDHSAWHESDATEDQIADKVKEIVNKAVEQTGDRACGNLPGYIQNAIDKLNYVPKDWRSDIQRFVARTSEILIHDSRKKRNRRYGILYAGQIKESKLHIANIIDTSGSVSDEEANQFFAEMARLYKMNIKITVIEHDAKVNNVYEFNPKKPYNISGRGGTSFKEAYEKAAELDVDGIIHFSDGECWDEQIPRPKVPVLAALIGGRNRTYPYKFASKTYVEVRKRVKR